MSTLKLQERFTLESPPEQVWEHLTDPRRTVRSLPGAEITGQEDERTYTGAVKVKLGSVTVAYRGKVVFEEIDADRRYVRVVGKGREKSGSGSADMTMESRVVALDGGGTEVTVDSEVRLTGKIVRFGRGMIDTVSAEIFKEFRSRLAEELRQEAGGASPEPATPSGGPAATAEPPGEEPLDQRPTGGAPAATSPTDDAIPLLPLLFRALRAWLRRLFGRG